MPLTKNSNDNYRSAEAQTLGASFCKGLEIVSSDATSVTKIHCRARKNTTQHSRQHNTTQWQWWDPSELDLGLTWGDPACASPSSSAPPVDSSPPGTQPAMHHSQQSPHSRRPDAGHAATKQQHAWLIFISKITEHIHVAQKPLTAAHEHTVQVYRVRCMGCSICSIWCTVITDMYLQYWAMCLNEHNFQVYDITKT